MKKGSDGKKSLYFFDKWDNEMKQNMKEYTKMDNQNRNRFCVNLNIWISKSVVYVHDINIQKKMMIKKVPRTKLSIDI